MSAASKEIADFLEKGGKVEKLQETVRVTGLEVVDYLVSCGFRVKYAPGDAAGYLYEGKRCSLSKLVGLANDHRRAHRLPPFAASVNISIGRKPRY